jgi:hypothetical protein
MTKRPTKKPSATARASVRRALQRALRLRHSVRVERYDGLDNVYGFPLAIGKELVLLHYTKDFDLDGYVVLPLSQIAEATLSAVQKFFDRVLNDRGDLRRVQLPKHEVALDTWIECARSLAATPQLLIVECEKRDSSIGATFYLGSIVAVSDDSMAMCDVDATAEWHDRPPAEIPYIDLTWIQFGDVYSRTFRKYVDTQPSY